MRDIDLADLRLSLVGLVMEHTRHGATMEDVVRACAVLEAASRRG